ncbi:hypothetical protein [Proteus terrae]|nr:hypothetical protein [Proteus terrae]MCW9688068.1 hypothetical protein [Proteus terrae]
MYGVYVKPDIGNEYYLDADDNQVMGYLGSAKIGWYNNHFYPINEG